MGIFWPLAGSLSSLRLRVRFVRAGVDEVPSISDRDSKLVLSHYGQPLYRQCLPALHVARSRRGGKSTSFDNYCSEEAG